MADDLIDIEKLFADDPVLAALLSDANAARDIRSPLAMDSLPEPAIPTGHLLNLDLDSINLDDLFADFQLPQIDDSQPAPPENGYAQAPDTAIQKFSQTFIPVPVTAPEAMILPDEDKPAKPQSAGRRFGCIFFDVLFYILILALIGSAAAFVMSTSVTKSYFGFRLYTVKTASMRPTTGPDGTIPRGGFRVGDAILVKRAAPENIKVGDIITFIPDSTKPEAVLTHRVVQIQKDLNGQPGIYFVTKGDANTSNDPPVSEETVVGKKVLTIPMLGVFLQFLRDNFVLALVAALSAFGFVLLLRIYLAGQPKKKRLTRKA